MSLDDIIASYIEQQRCLGKRFAREATILAAFKNAVNDVPLRDIRSEMISVFANRGGTSDATRQKKYRVVAGLFRFAVTRHQLRTSPVPQRPRKRTYSSYVPYVYSEAELKRFLAAVPAATVNFTVCNRCRYAARFIAAVVRRWTPPRRSVASQDQRRRHLAITHTHSRNEVLQDTHRPPERQSEHRHTDVHRKTG